MLWTNRQITKVERDEKTAQVTLTLECGHQKEPNPIFTYYVGEFFKCFECKQEKERK